MNLLRATTIPVRLYTSFVLLGDCISISACIFSGLGYVHHYLTMNPSNFLGAMPNVHFSGFSFIRYILRVLNVSAKCETWSEEI